MSPALYHHHRGQLTVLAHSNVRGGCKFHDRLRRHSTDNLRHVTLSQFVPSDTLTRSWALLTEPHPWRLMTTTTNESPIRLSTGNRWGGLPWNCSMAVVGSAVHPCLRSRKFIAGGDLFVFAGFLALVVHCIGPKDFMRGCGPHCAHCPPGEPVEVCWLVDRAV